MPSIRRSRSRSEPAEQPEVRTFLFADFRGYTRFTHEQGDEAAATLVRRFAGLAKQTVEARSGRVIEMRGDEILATFRSARQALLAAIDLQQRWEAESARDLARSLPLGIGLDVGEAVRVGEGYRGQALNVAARLCSLAGPSEILATETVATLARKTEGIIYVERGAVPIKGLPKPVSIVGVRPSQSTVSEQGGGRAASAGASSSGPALLPVGGFLGTQPEGALIERREEMERVLAAIAAVAQPSASGTRLLMLSGEPGIGKTRLAQEATVHLVEQGFLTVAGRCYESRGAVPFYPFLDALAALVETCPAGPRAQIPLRWPRLSLLLPLVGAEPGAAHGAGHGFAAAGPEEQEHLFRAATGFILAVAEEQPIAILLDDLHWADTSSLDLLQHLARNTQGRRVFLLGTYRDTDTGGNHALERALLDMRREHLVESIKVTRLKQEGTAALVAATLGAEPGAADLSPLIHRWTDGNAFFIQELVRALLEERDLLRKDGRWDLAALQSGAPFGSLPLPESVRGVVAQRVSRLAESSQAILWEASVLGQDFRFDDLQAMTGRSEASLERALEEAAAAGLAQEASADAYIFSHALIQQSLYSELLGRRRRHLHLTAAEALIRPGRRPAPRAAEPARHFQEGGDSIRALRYTILAGDEAAMVYAHADAEQQYRAALELAAAVEPATNVGPAREVHSLSVGAGRPAQLKYEAEALEKLGMTLKIVSRYDEALDVLERAGAKWRSAGDLEGEARTIAQIGLVHHVRGTPREGIARIERLVQALPEDMLLRAGPNLFIALANLFFTTGQFQEALAVSERAQALARAIDGSSDRNGPKPLLETAGLLAETAVPRATALLLLGRQKEALGVLEEALAAAEGTNDAATLSLILDLLADIHLASGDFSLCRDRREQTLALFERLGDPAKIDYGLAALGLVLVYSGEWRQARQRFERAADIASQFSSSWVAAWPPIGLGMCDLAEGHLERARRLLEEGIAISERTSGAETLMYGQRCLAECDLLEAHPEVAVERLERLLEQLARPEGYLVSVLPVLAQAYFEAGNAVQASTLLKEGLDRATSQGNLVAQVEMLRVRGNILAADGRWSEASEAFATAVERAHAMPYPLAEARTLLAWGSARPPAQPESQDRVRHALAIFRRLGAHLDTDRAERALASLAQVTAHEA